MEKEEAKIYETKKTEEQEFLKNNINESDLFVNKVAVKENSNKITISESSEDNLALLKELSENKEENIKQLLKRKKLSEDEEGNEKTVKFI